MGVVRQEVKMSAGRSGFMGSTCSAEQAASWMQFLNDGGATRFAVAAFACCHNNITVIIYAYILILSTNYLLVS